MWQGQETTLITFGGLAWNRSLSSTLTTINRTTQPSKHVTKEHKNTFDVVRFGICKSATVKMSIFFLLYVTLDCSMERNKRQKSIFEVKRNGN
jgi:hypothetical protein